MDVPIGWLLLVTINICIPPSPERELERALQCKKPGRKRTHGAKYVRCRGNPMWPGSCSTDRQWRGTTPSPRPGTRRFSAINVPLPRARLEFVEHLLGVLLDVSRRSAGHQFVETSRYFVGLRGVRFPQRFDSLRKLIHTTSQFARVDDILQGRFHLIKRRHRRGLNLDS